MIPTKDMPGIADANRPNAGRIYDYLLGGNHNFEIDRQAAQKVIEIAPFFPKYFRTIRWFLGEAVRRLCAEGFTKFIDFASGLPTQDHIHQVAPPGTKVIYSDIDPVTVAYGQQIIGDNPNIRFVQCDAGKPEKLFNSPVVEELFVKDRRLAIGFNGICWFLDDETLAHSLKVIYDWADKGTKLFLSDNDVPKLSEQGQKMVDLYKNYQELYIRSLKKAKELIGSWTVPEPGFKALQDWIGLGKDVSETMTEVLGGHSFGAILEKR